MQYILITGGAGNIGGSLAKKLVQDANNFIVIVDNLITGNISKLPTTSYLNWKFIKCDVNIYNEIASIMIHYKFDYVFHYAAIVGVKRTLDNPIMVLNDIEGFKNILLLSKNLSVKRVFFSSSSEVYGEPVEFPQNEDTTPLNSRLPYAIVKNVNEAYLKSYNREFGLDYTIFRFFNTYGPQQSEDFVIIKFLKAALSGRPITMFGDGSQTRTFCYIQDNIDVTVSCLSDNTTINAVLNVGNENEISILNLAKMIIKLTNSNSQIEFLPALVEGDMTRRLPDISKMKSILQRPLITLEEGLLKTIESLKLG